jgi:glucosamine-phosphate N-acetyltransferase
MNYLKYDSFLSIIENNQDKLEEIKNQYLSLLSFLTTTENMLTDDFYHKITEIFEYGYIIVCYYEDIEKNKINIIGTGTVIFEPKIIHSGKYVGHIEDIVVCNEYRSNGIARNIMEKLKDISKNKNCYKIILDCKKDLFSFYNKMGFDEKGIQMSMYFE